MIAALARAEANVYVLNTNGYIHDEMCVNTRFSADCLLDFALRLLRNFYEKKMRGAIHYDIIGGGFEILKIVSAMPERRARPSIRGVTVISFSSALSRHAKKCASTKTHLTATPDRYKDKTAAADSPTFLAVPWLLCQALFHGSAGLI